MSKKEQKYNELITEFTNLKDTTELVAQIVTRGGTYTPQYINNDDFIKRIEIAKDLYKNYQEFSRSNYDVWYDVCRWAK
jgi:hypothetical protein